MNYVKEAPMVSVIIVNYNGKFYLEGCLDSVFKNTYPNYEVIVVDNASSDGSSEHIKKIFAGHNNFHVIENESNLGPSSARNKGIYSAAGKYIAFLDNDTIVHPSWLVESIKLLESNSDIGIVQCKLIIQNTNDVLDCVGEYLNQYGFLFHVVKPCKEADRGQYDNLRYIFSAKSAAMVSRTYILKILSGFDEDYFIYMEETDLAWRSWLVGFKVAFCPKSVVYHLFSTSSKILSKKQNSYNVRFHGTKNHILTLIKNLGTIKLIFILPAHLFVWFGLVFIHTCRGEYDVALYILKGILWNVFFLHRNLRKRNIIQSTRKLSDEFLFRLIRKKQSFIQRAKQCFVVDSR